MLSRNWVSEMMGKALESVLMKLRDDERFTWSTSSAACIMICFASFPSERFKLIITRAYSK